MITWTHGDLFTIDVPAIAHGVNCRGVMGAGIAKQFRERWPAMYTSYRRRCEKRQFIPGDVMTWQAPGQLIFNLATQELPGADARPWMITAAVGRMITEAVNDYGIRQVAMPMIGCGIGGLAREDLTAALAPYQDAPVNLIVVEWKAPS